ncbi:hypothetical protein D3C87_970820 [compost metagenome]
MRIVKTHHEIDNGGLAAAGGTDQGRHLAALEKDADVLQNRLARNIFEANILQFHIAAGFGKGQGILFLGERQRCVQHLEHHAHADHAAFDLYSHTGQTFCRFVSQKQGGDKGHEVAG